MMKYANGILWDMKIDTIMTKKIKIGDNLFDILSTSIKKLPEKSIVVISSKIVGISEGRVVNPKKSDRKKLIREEASYFIPGERREITIKHGTLFLSSGGIDESNAFGMWALLPKDPQKSANKARKFLIKRFGIKKLGVIITDSKLIPLRRGAVGTCMAYSGINPLKNYVGKKDLFGRKFKSEVANLIEGLASSATLVMGEGDEQTPIAIISDVDFLEFRKKNPSRKEIKNVYIELKQDRFYPILSKAGWQNQTEK